MRGLRAIYRWGNLFRPASLTSARLAVTSRPNATEIGLRPRHPAWEGLKDLLKHIARAEKGHQEVSQYAKAHAAALRI